MYSVGPGPHLKESTQTERNFIGIHGNIKVDTNSVLNLLSNLIINSKSYPLGHFGGKWLFSDLFLTNT